MTNKSHSEDICCPRFDPTPWDDKTHEWNNKLFIRDKVCTLFYMPLNFGGAMKRLDASVRASGAEIPDSLCLSEHTSPWKMNIYLAVDKPVDAADNTQLSGKYYSKVYEGSYQDTSKWYKDIVGITKSAGHDVKKWYNWYTTCPKCAKKYGKNYVVIFGRIG